MRTTFVRTSGQMIIKLERTISASNIPIRRGIVNNIGTILKQNRPGKAHMAFAEVPSGLETSLR